MPMKIVFIGDSLTEGIPGASYFKFVDQRLRRHDLINLGKGGDTVVSLLERIKRSCLAEDYDIAVIEVGVNDIYEKVSKTFPFINNLIRRRNAGNREEFKACYRELLDYMQQKARKLILIPPLFLGEDPESMWNGELKQIAEIIEAAAKEYDNAVFLDVGRTFAGQLQGKPVNGYISRNVFTVITDALLLKSNKSIDKKSKERGLHFTLDGVHLNSIGAEILSKALVDAIQRIAAG